MSMRIRKMAFAAGAAALLSGQAIASTASVGPAIDPLVSLSVLGSAQSRAALCAGSTAAAAAATAAAQGPGACVLPVTVAPAPVPVQTTTYVAPQAGKSLGVWPILLGLAAIVALAALLLGDGDGDGDIEPISP